MHSDRELNVNLLNQLDLIEETLAIATGENAEKTKAFLEMKKKQVERKLYQKPPLFGSEE